MRIEGMPSAISRSAFNTLAPPTSQAPLDNPGAGEARSASDLVAEAGRTLRDMDELLEGMLRRSKAYTDRPGAAPSAAPSVNRASAALAYGDSSTAGPPGASASGGEADDVWASARELDRLVEDLASRFAVQTTVNVVR